MGKCSKINSFPELGTEIFLPFYLAAIGFNECEGDIKRDEGYCTHLILYALSGRGELIVNGEKHILEADSSFVLRKNVPHKYRALTKDWDTHWVSFDGFACDKMLDVMHIGDYAVYHNMNLEELNVRTIVSWQQKDSWNNTISKISPLLILLIMHMFHLSICADYSKNM